jgi:hypothetical protein
MTKLSGYQFPKCLGKTAHLTMKAAAVELKRRAGPRMKIFKCRECDAYHIVHDVRKRGNARP